MVHFVNHQICPVASHYALVVLPTFGIGVAQVNDIRLLPIDTYRLGKDSRRVAVSCVKDIRLPFLVTLDGRSPQTVASLLHAHQFLANPDRTLGIVRGKEFEGGLLL